MKLLLSKSYGVLVVLWLSWVTTSTSFAEPPPDIDIVSQVNQASITIGDRFEYTISVRFPKEGRIELPSVLGNLGAFEVKDYQSGNPLSENGRLKQTWRFTLSTFTVGDYIIPPQRVEYRHASDTLTKIYETQPIAITVKRTSPENIKDIADITDPIDLPGPKPWGLMALVGLLLGALGVWIWQRQKPAAQGLLEKPSLPPFEEAMAALNALDPVGAVRQNKAREFSFSVSHLLRKYLSRRYEVEALESTSEEFLGMIQRLPFSTAQLDMLRRFCEATDLVKFANAPLFESEAQNWCVQLREFIASTKPVPKPVTESPKVDNSNLSATSPRPSHSEKKA